MPASDIITRFLIQIHYKDNEVKKMEIKISDFFFYNDWKGIALLKTKLICCIKMNTQYVEICGVVHSMLNLKQNLSVFKVIFICWEEFLADSVTQTFNLSYGCEDKEKAVFFIHYCSFG